MPYQSQWHADQLLDRDSQRRVLDRLVSSARAGESGVLVLRGDPGVGKTALLAHLEDRVAGCRVVRAAGVQSEMELAYAGLHRLLAPVLDRLEVLPPPQREAMEPRRYLLSTLTGPAGNAAVRLG